MSVLERIISLYAPHVCLGCSLEGSLLCNDCHQGLVSATACCYQCQRPSRLGRLCADCRPRSGLVSLNCVANYTGLAKDVLWALKFDRAQAAADIIARSMAAVYGDVTPSDALIVPVPTAAKRVRRRGYDQAALIARSYARQAGCQYSPVLLRHGKQEQKGAGRELRRQQLTGALSLKPGKDVTGRRIILIDDVVTTGASLEAAAAVLKASGARTIAGLVFARA
jgi:ComF family protein